MGFALLVCEDGDSVWYREYQHLIGGYSSNYLRDLRPTADGGFVAAGFMFPRAPDTGTQAAWLLKLDSAGYPIAGGAVPGRVCPRPLGLVEAAAEAEVTVWPNPSPDGRFTLSASRAGGRYEVRDALGQRVLGTTNSGETAVELSQQPQGVYVLRLTWPDGRTLTRKLVR